MLENARRLAPDQLEPVLRLAQLYETRAESTGSNWDKAAYLYGQCIERYPNNAGLHARLSRARWEDGDLDGAKMAAARAIQLDSQTAHADHKLTPAERRLLEPLQAHRAPVE
jgi:predicted Zn-dependent protease